MLVRQCMLKLPAEWKLSDLRAAIKEIESITDYGEYARAEELRHFWSRKGIIVQGESGFTSWRWATEKQH